MPGGFKHGRARFYPDSSDALCGGVNRRTVSRFWNSQSLLDRGLNPEFDGVRDIRDRLFRRIAMC